MPVDRTPTLRTMDRDHATAELERLLAAASEDPAERPAFTLALLAAQVYVLGCLDPPPVRGKAQVGSSAQILTWEDDQGSITPFFTSQAALDGTLAALPGTDPHFLQMNTRDFFRLVAGQRLVLNPHDPYGKVYLPHEVQALLVGSEPGVTTEVLQAERQVLVGAAAHVPDALPAVLARHFTQRRGVCSAHLGWIAHPDGHQGYLLVVQAADREAATAGFGTLQIGDLTGGETIDVIVVPPDTTEHPLQAVPPFYTRRPQPDLPSAKRRKLWRRGS